MNAQVQIVRESFGPSSWEGAPEDYPLYTSDALFAGDNPHQYNVGNSTGYENASGGAAVDMGSWSGEFNREFVMRYNTADYSSVRLSFGIHHNSNGWGTCQLTNNYTKIEYSSDSVNWTEIDKASLMEGSFWPCADDQIWSYIQLAEVLPSNATLNIRFTHTDPSIHPFQLDDITLTGYRPDLTPPSTPTGLRAEKIEFSSFILIWDASEDENGIDHYEIYKDGYYLMSAKDLAVRIQYQMPGSSAGFSVKAIDVSDNESSLSSELPVSFESIPANHRYAWESPQVKIKPGGDMEWQPEAYEFISGPSVRYIDFEGGDDSNDGQSKTTPWKHHPWDDNAKDLAAECLGIHTYVFKRGVVYRGVLTANSSGSPLEPIRLTSDPSWGSGEAFFFGSERIESGWMKADAASAPNIPEPEKVWYIDVELPNTKIVCELKGDEITPLHVARSPNYQYTPDDPLKTWWKWTAKTVSDGALYLTDNQNLVQMDPDYYRGATVFSQEDAIVMCTVWKQDVEEWDPAKRRVRVANTNFGGLGSHYFIENTPFLLDTTGEFYYDEIAKRLFVRMSGEADPNTAVLEVATRTKLISIANKHDIEVSGLSFGFTTSHTIRYGQSDVASTIRITGICSNIEIHHNDFYYVNGGISVNNTGSQAVNTHSIKVSDNKLRHIGDMAIVFATDHTYMDDIHILRNQIYNNGYRHQGRWYGSIPAIYGQVNYGQVAGNIIDVSWGNGIDMFWGKGGSDNSHVPFVRGFIYQNKASNTLIGTNDYGGIESWQGGPVYCYNNLSKNASGYKHYNNSSIGYAYYFDGSFKHSVFNNVATGVSHNRNAASIMQVLGYNNLYIHNTAYNTNTFFNAWKGTLALNGHNTYLANVGEEIQWFFRHEIDPLYIPFESYGNNVSAASPFMSTLTNRDQGHDLEEFTLALEGYKSQLTQTGWNESEAAISNAEADDYRPLANSMAIDKGIKFFTAFPLASVVGEWNFYRHPADSTIIMSDNFYMTEDFNDRETYHEVPKNHLTAFNVADSNFVTGILEDWTQGALQFDGSSVYCSIDHETSSATKSNNVDMALNDFIIEAYIKSDTGHTGGIIVSKYGGSVGYELDINELGQARIILFENGSVKISVSSAVAVNEGGWHHLLAEIRRSSGINLFVDGVPANGTMTGEMPAAEMSLSNSTDMLIGKNKDNSYFSGTVDFLRLSRGNLFDARTTIGELYQWQSDGPFLYDLAGKAPIGKRDAGAIEASASCELSLSEDSLHFSEVQTEKIILIQASGAYSIRDISGEFFTLTLLEDTILVSVRDNPGLEDLNGSFTVVGCGHTALVKISQEGTPCNFICDVNALQLTSSEQTIVIPVTTNGDITVSSDQGFVDAGVVNPGDSVYIHVDQNLSDQEREAEVWIEYCLGIHTIAVTQDANPVHTGELNPGEISIYPNPVTEKHFRIIFPGWVKELDYTISDLSGKALQNGKIYSSEEVILLKVDQGSYFLSIMGDDLNFKKVLIVL